MTEVLGCLTAVAAVSNVSLLSASDELSAAGSVTVKLGTWNMEHGPLSTPLLESFLSCSDFSVFVLLNM